MKKYHQLFLLLTSIASLTLFLVYRHHYNSLHYVLEVFNFFGQPCNISNLQLQENIQLQHDWGPAPLWQADGNIITYSGYWNNNNEAKVIVLRDQSKVTVKSCYLWYEDKEQPIIGKFHPVKVDRNAKIHTVFFYLCASSKYRRSPYAVSFAANKVETSKLVKIPLTNTYRHKFTFNATMCVMPSKFFSKSRLVEFLSFHKLIGFDSFIFYSNNIPHDLQKVLLNLSDRLGVKLTFFPWNFYSTNTTLLYKIVEMDCTLRTSNDSMRAMVLHMNEYIVPVGHQTFNEIIQSVNKNLVRLVIPVVTFCIQNENPNIPMAVQNTNALRDDYKEMYNIIINGNERNATGRQMLDKHAASIFRYERCLDNSLATHIDNSVLKYSLDFVRSTLMQLLLHKHI